MFLRQMMRARRRDAVVLSLALVGVVGAGGAASATPLGSARGDLVAPEQLGALPVLRKPAPKAPLAAAQTSEVAGPTATLLLTAPGKGASWAHAATASAVNDVRSTIAVSAQQTGGGTYVSVQGRKTSSSTDYRLKVRYRVDGAVTAALVRYESGVETALQSVALPGVAAGQPAKVRLVVEGAAPTTLRAKVWSASSAEPSPWQLTATDGSAGLQAPGRVGALAYLSASSTSAPETISFTDLSVVSGVPVINGSIAPDGLSASSSARFELTTPRADIALRCGLDGSSLQPCTSPVAYSALADGSHVLNVIAVDAAGVQTGAASRRWTVDATVPDTTLQATNLSGSGASLTFASTESGGGFTCRTDRQVWQTCTSPMTLSGLQPGSHVFEARASDRAGNVDPSPATANWSAASPSGVRPGSTNTGVPAGTALTPHYGDLTITTAGTHIDGMDLHGFLNIKAPDVTVTRSIIRGGATTTNRSLVQSTGARMSISDSTLVPEVPSVHIDGLKGYGFTATRLDISGTVDTALIYGNDSTIQDSWLHDNAHYQVDPNQGGGPSHDDNVQVQGGNNITLQRNSMAGGWNSAVQVTQDYSVTSNLRVAGNWLGGGGCTVNIAEKGRGPILGLAVTDNQFARDSRIVNCPIISPVTTPLVAERNTWLDTGEPALVRRGA